MRRKTFGRPTLGRASRTAFKAALLATVAIPSLPAQSADLEIDNEVNQSVSTSVGDGTGPGNISITDGGSIVLTGGTGATVDSSHSLNNAGIIEIDTTANGVGVLVLTGPGIASSITNSGTIMVRSSDPDIENIGPNFAVLVQGAGAFTGDITFTDSSSISVSGANSIALGVEAPVIGNILADGTTAVEGDNGIGILIDNSLSGDLSTGGLISVAGRDGVGVSVQGDIGGTLSIGGSVGVGSASTLDGAGERVQGDPALAGVLVNADVAGGVINRFRQAVADDPDTPDVDESVSGLNGVISTIGGGPGILVTTEDAVNGDRNVLIGAVGTGDDAFGIINQATINSVADFPGIAVTGLRVEGSNDGVTDFFADITGGISNSGSLSAASLDSSATAISIGTNAIVPEIFNSGTLGASSTRTSTDDDGDGVADSFGPGGDVVGILIESGAQVDRIINTGIIRAVAAGDTGDAFGIVDLSGNLSEIFNSGSIMTSVDEEGFGLMVAIDASLVSGGLLLTNEGTIEGDVLLGAGSDTVSFDAGVMTGDLDFGGGGGSFSLINESEFSGRLFRGQGVSASISNSRLLLDSTNFSAVLGDLSLTNNAVLAVGISGIDQSAAALNIEGTAFLEAGTRIEPEFERFSFADREFVFLTAANLILGGGVEGLDLSGGSILFETEVLEVQDVTDSLVLRLRRKSAAEVGLNSNQGILYDAAIPVLELDEEFGATLANIDTLEAARVAFSEMLPDIVTGATREAALVGQNLAYGAVRGRLQGLRDLQTIDRAAERRQQETGIQPVDVFAEDPDSALWGQEFVYLYDRDATAEHLGYDGFSVGFGLGYDVAALGLDALGIGLVQTFTEFEDDLARDDEIFVSSSNIMLYASLNGAGFFIDLMGSAGYNTYNNERLVTVTDVVRQAEGDWSGYQFNGNATVGYRLNLGRVGVTASSSLGYMSLHENGYEEKNGGTAIDLAIESRDWESLRANAGVTIDTRFEGNNITFIPMLRAGATRELRDDAEPINLRFLNGGDSFTLLSAEPVKNLYNAGGSIGVAVGQAIVTIDYDAEWSSRSFAHIGGINFRIRF